MQMAALTIVSHADDASPWRQISSHLFLYLLIELFAGVCFVNCPVCQRVFPFSWNLEASPGKIPDHYKA
jgi:hypothetical protein